MKDGKPSLTKTPEYSLETYLESDAFKRHQEDSDRFMKEIELFKRKIYESLMVPKAFFEGKS